MKKTLFIAASLLTLCLFNWSIYAKEQIIQNGDLVYLALAPVDPRSLMQGDYMRLNYEVSNGIPAGITSFPAQGDIVITVDADRVGHYAHIDTGAPLQPNEKRLRYHHDYRTTIAPDSYMFQEGQASFFRQAKYGVFRFDGTDSKVLVGLADEHKHLIDPGPQPPPPPVQTRSQNILHFVR